MASLDRSDAQKLVASYTSVLEQAERIMNVAKHLEGANRKALEETALRLIDEADAMTTVVKKAGR